MDLACSSVQSLRRPGKWTLSTNDCWVVGERQSGAKVWDPGAIELKKKRVGGGGKHSKWPRECTESNY